jgi:hypothetical protein
MASSLCKPSRSRFDAFGRLRNIKKHKKQKYKELIKKETKSYSGIDFEKLRAERLLREQSEKLRSEVLLAKVKGEPMPIVIFATSMI